jgi:hypothetical protein
MEKHPDTQGRSPCSRALTNTRLQQCVNRAGHRATPQSLTPRATHALTIPFARVTLNATYPVPVPLDQLLVQYYFNGPEDLDAGAATPAKGLSPQAAAELAGAQFRAACTDASPAIGVCMLLFV